MTVTLTFCIYFPSDVFNNLKIYVYDLPSKFNTDWLANDRCSNHLFAAEVALHKALLSLEGDVRTKDPHEADFFFVPVYVSCNFSTVNGFPAIGHARSLIKEAIELVSAQYPFWNRTILQTFGVTFKHPCQEVENVVIPPYISPVSLHKTQKNIPVTKERDIRVFFRGKMEIHPRNISGRFYSKRVRTEIWRSYGSDRRSIVPIPWRKVKTVSDTGSHDIVGTASPGTRFDGVIGALAGTEAEPVVTPPNRSRHRSNHRSTIKQEHD
ncbi:hypothetical protein F2Q70_00025615 [Brassica cretica]|uniref:Exostosin GT47 domain-containing protein n=1 Tax=Brassica cretica TaxID=69181 RepID=A0A8S9LAB8_BRACR|nr:hypothetical protein F2Q70_00025615 [Brassica cretica]